MGIKVINLRFLRRMGYDSIEDWIRADPNHLYVGRNLEKYAKNCQQKTDWGNPYP